MSCNSAEVAANDGSSNGGEKQQQQEEEVVCVTGAGGFIGSWVVKEHLLRGYRVRGTARDPTKNAHLLALDGAGERLTLCRADVLDSESLRAAFAGCHGVFHVASPVSNDPVYCYAKTMAEKAAEEEAAKRGVQLAVVLPCVTVGPILHPAINTSINHVVRYLTGAAPTYPNAVAAYVDVRDVARAHALVYERPDASGRYLCIGTVLHRAHLLQMLKELFPQYPVTSKCKDDGNPMKEPYRFSNKRLKDLGLEFTPMRKCLCDAVVCMQQKGHLPLVGTVPKCDL
ncbi:hypothetical protein EE612_014401 [Oryza sativa]|nr:hypothetical protein EE612_014401 [Oryza sativa]